MMSLSVSHFIFQWPISCHVLKNFHYFSAALHTILEGRSIITFWVPARQPRFLRSVAAFLTSCYLLLLRFEVRTRLWFVGLPILFPNVQFWFKVRANTLLNRTELRHPLLQANVLPSSLLACRWRRSWPLVGLLPSLITPLLSAKSMLPTCH